MKTGRRPDEWFKSEECKRVVELAKEGYSEGRIAEIVGIKKSRVTYVKRLFGIKGAREFTTSGIKYEEKWYALHKQAIACQDRNTKTKLTKESHLAFDLDSIGFDYLGGYSGRNSHIEIRCRTCNGTFTRYADRQFKVRVQNNQIECPCCIEKARLLREEIARQKEQKRIFFAEQKRKRKEIQQRAKLNQETTCKECGKKFTLAEYREKEQTEHCGLTVYCSSECRKKAERKNRRKYNVTHGKHKLRSIKYGVEFDRTVNLDDMLIRYGTKCSLCGGECNINDYKIVNGARIYGDDYPSIDHIKPMSRGGGHTWDNVQVAHRGCNTKKGTNEVA